MLPTLFLSYTLSMLGIGLDTSHLSPEVLAVFEQSRAAYGVAEKVPFGRSLQASSVKTRVPWASDVERPVGTIFQVGPRRACAVGWSTVAEGTAAANASIGVWDDRAWFHFATREEPVVLELTPAQRDFVQLALSPFPLYRLAADFEGFRHAPPQGRHPRNVLFAMHRNGVQYAFALTPTEGYLHVMSAGDCKAVYGGHRTIAGTLIPQHLEITIEIDRFGHRDPKPHKITLQLDSVEAPGKAWDVRSCVPADVRTQLALGDSNRTREPRLLYPPKPVPAVDVRDISDPVELARISARGWYESFWEKRSREKDATAREIEGLRERLADMRARGALAMVKAIEKELRSAEEKGKQLATVTYKDLPISMNPKAYRLFLADLPGGQSRASLIERLRFKKPDIPSKDHRTLVDKIISWIEADEIEKAQQGLDSVWTWVLGEPSAAKEPQATASHPAKSEEKQQPDFGPGVTVHLNKLSWLVFAELELRSKLGYPGRPVHRIQPWKGNYGIQLLKDGPFVYHLGAHGDLRQVCDVSELRAKLNDSALAQLSLKKMGYQPIHGRDWEERLESMREHRSHFTPPVNDAADFKATFVDPERNPWDLFDVAAFGDRIVVAPKAANWLLGILLCDEGKAPRWTQPKKYWPLGSKALLGQNGWTWFHRGNIWNWSLEGAETFKAVPPYTHATILRPDLAVLWGRGPEGSVYACLTEDGVAAKTLTLKPGERELRVVVRGGGGGAPHCLYALEQPLTDGRWGLQLFEFRRDGVWPVHPRVDVSQREGLGTSFERPGFHWCAPVNGGKQLIVEQESARVREILDTTTGKITKVRSKALVAAPPGSSRLRQRAYARRGPAPHVVFAGDAYWPSDHSLGSPTYYVTRSKDGASGEMAIGDPDQWRRLLGCSEPPTWWWLTNTAKGSWFVAASTKRMTEGLRDGYTLVFVEYERIESQIAEVGAAVRETEAGPQRR